MQAVEAISERVAIFTSEKYTNVKRFESAAPVHDKFSTPIYRDDTRLSLPAAGVCFPAVDVRAFETEIPFSVRISFSSCSTCAARSTI